MEADPSKAIKQNLGSLSDIASERLRAWAYLTGENRLSLLVARHVMADNIEGAIEAASAEYPEIDIAVQISADYKANKTAAQTK